MSTPAHVHVGDVGTDIILNCDTDVSTLATAKIKYRKPDGTTGEWGADLSGDNAIHYIIEEGDLDVAGTWVLQAFVEFTIEGEGEEESITWSGHGEEVTMRVFSTLPEIVGGD